MPYKTYSDVSGNQYTIGSTDKVQENSETVLEFIEETYDRVFEPSEKARYIGNMEESVGMGMAFSIAVNGVEHGFIYLRRVKAYEVYVDSLWVSTENIKCKMLLMDFILTEYDVVRYIPVNNDIRPIVSMLDPRSVQLYFSGSNKTIKSRSKSTVPSTEKLLKYLQLEEVV